MGVVAGREAPATSGVPPAGAVCTTLTADTAANVGSPAARASTRAAGREIGRAGALTSPTQPQ